MDEELWLDYYYGRKNGKEEEPEQTEEAPEEIDDRASEPERKEKEPEQPHEERQPEEPKEQPLSNNKPKHERSHWSRGRRDRDRITGRNRPTIISIQKEVKKERPHDLLLQKYHNVMQLAFDAVRALKNPNEGKRSIYFVGRTYELKDESKLAPSTRIKYEREKKAMLELEKALNKEEMIIDIIRTATQQSRSTYFRRKAILERIYAERTDEDSRKMLSLLRHMPDYHRIRHIFNQKIEKSRETDKRRNCKIGMDAVLDYMREVKSHKHPMMQLVPLILYHTGARVSEVQGMKIYAEPDNSLTIRIKSMKTGCARSAPATRTVKITDKQICALLKSNHIGTTITDPFVGIPTQTIRNNMLAARRRLSRRGIDVPSPHYFRHNFATRERAAGIDNEQLRKELGHTNQETTRQYGGGNFHQK